MFRRIPPAPGDCISTLGICQEPRQNGCSFHREHVWTISLNQPERPRPVKHYESNDRLFFPSIFHLIMPYPSPVLKKKDMKRKKRMKMRLVVTFWEMGFPGNKSTLEVSHCEQVPGFRGAETSRRSNTRNTCVIKLSVLLTPEMLRLTKLIRERIWKRFYKNIAITLVMTNSCMINLWLRACI